jgi:valyl-tRNA synthetase
MMNIGDNNGGPQLDLSEKLKRPEKLPLMDRWILSRLNATIKTVSDQLHGFRFNAAAKALYDFIWHDYCDWYIELVKTRLYGESDEADKELARSITAHVLNDILLLLHPYAPFITDEIWHLLHGRERFDDTIMVQRYPESQEYLIDIGLEEMMEKLQRVVNAIRTIRAEMNVPPSKRAEVHLKITDAELLQTLEHNQEYLMNLGKIDKLVIGANSAKPPMSASAVIPAGEIYVPLADLIDIGVERKRLQKELEKVAGLLERSRRKLSNQEFVNQAPKDVVEREENKKREYEEMATRINRNLEQLLDW